MIHRIYSDLPSFKTIIFKNGFNVLLADKSPEASDLQTRNGSGKSSLLQIIHFLMGAKCDKNSIFRTKSLINYKFGMEFEIEDIKITVERLGKNPSKVIVERENHEWPVSMPWERKSKNVLSVTNWKLILAIMIFQLTNETDDIVDVSQRFKPSFRSLFSYLVRRQDAGGFFNPEKNAVLQQTWDEQVAISFLLGLDWSVSQELQQIREREKVLEKLKSAIKDGAFGTIIRSTSEIRTRLIVAEERTKRLQDNLSEFQVHQEYRVIELEASKLTRQLSDLSNENVIDRESIQEMQESVSYEEAPLLNNLDDLFKEAGIILPDTALRRFAEVKLFHDTIIFNRKSYLDSEIDDAFKRISEREGLILRLSIRRSELMEILRTHGALEQYTKLQAELSRAEVNTEGLRQQLLTAEQLEHGRNELDIERAKLFTRLKQDHQEQSELIKKAILTFERISSSLYEQAGSLEIQESLNGPQFKVKMHGSKSKGINNMQIFCFDIMVMILLSERGIGPNFLVHDSHLFDGVDDRQVARAFYIGAKTAEELRFQYIVTINSNDLPLSFPEDFNIDNYILPVRLTDQSEEGGLFGLRFE